MSDKHTSFKPGATADNILELLKGASSSEKRECVTMVLATLGLKAVPALSPNQAVQAPTRSMGPMAKKQGPSKKGNHVSNKSPEERAILKEIKRLNKEISHEASILNASLPDSHTLLQQRQDQFRLLEESKLAKALPLRP